MIKIVYFSTPKIGLESLKYLAKSDKVKVLGVVTRVDKPAGRGHKLTPPPVKVLAEQLGIDVYQTSSISKDTELQKTLRKLAPDYFVTFAFGHILSKEVLDIPKIATINLHASLLPKYRGANPIQRVIANGDKKTGITTMITEHELDSGDICLKEEIIITPKMTDIELSQVISQKAPKLIEKTLAGLKNGTIKPLKQNHEEATFARKFKKEEVNLDFTKKAQELANLIRAVCAGPAAYTVFNGKVIKILNAEAIEKEGKTAAGTLVQKDKNGLFVNAGSEILLIKRVKPEGKGEMDAAAWANGAGIKIGDKFGE